MSTDSLGTSLDSLVSLARAIHPHHTSAVEIVAVAGVFLIPIVAIVLAMAVTLNASNKRHIERMKMIEAGMIPSQLKSKPGYGLLSGGAILLAVGLALFISELAKSGGDIEAGLICGLMGLAMLGTFAYRRHVSAKEPTEAGPQPVATNRPNPPERPATNHNEPPVS
jgi:hypothetical protein